MTTDQRPTIVVIGATGLQGSAVARHLLNSGQWCVRALTRRRESEAAQALSAGGAEVVQGDMSDPASLAQVFEGAYGVYSMQNPYISGIEGEIQQGKNVADAARRAGVQHVVYGSAGVDARGTGVPSWESKLVIEDYMRSLDLPLTVLSPMAFMEIMTEKKFYPAAAAWKLMPDLTGGGTKIGWICVDDLGFIAAKAFAEPEQFTGKKLILASDAQSLDECRAIYRDALGKPPPRFPMPLWLFKRFGIIGQDLTSMWRWLRQADLHLDTAPTLAVHPGALSVRRWLEKEAASGG